MEFTEALAKTFLAEVEIFGEDVFFKGNTFKASVGFSEQNKALQMSGYYEEQALEVIIPLPYLIGLSQDPRVNEIIELRGKGYRIDRIEKSESSIELNVELVNGYKIKEKEVTNSIQAKAPSEVIATIL